MAGLEQLNSFIGKFVSLWQAGLDASLELKTFHGEASAHIHVGLGQAPCLQKTHQTSHRFLSPSHLRSPHNGKTHETNSNLMITNLWLTLGRATKNEPTHREPAIKIVVK